MRTGIDKEELDDMVKVSWWDRLYWWIINWF
jgi:hypothetical protein